MVTGFEWHGWVPGHLETPDGPPDDGGPVEPTGWEARAPLPAARQVFTANVVDGKIYAAGGGAYRQVSTALTCYDPAANAWTAKAPLPAAVYLHWAGVLDGKLYVGGGRDRDDFPSAVTRVYDPATDSWATKAPNPWGSRNDIVDTALAVGGKLYVPGGTSNDAYNGTTNTLTVYDPATDTWSIKAALPEGRIFHAAEACDGKLWVIGGETAANVARATLYAYDPAANAWTTKAPLPATRTRMQVVSVGRKLYVLGGRAAPFTGPVADVFVYDIDTDTWATHPYPLTTPVTDGAAVAIAGDIYLLGGNTDAGESLSTATAQVWRSTVPTTAPPPPDEPVLVPGAYVLDEDRTAGLMSWAITYGRTDYTAKVTPLTATVGLAGYFAAPCPVGGERFRLALSDELADALGLTEAERIRYTGEVTDATIDPRSPVSDVYTITGAGRLGRYRRRNVDGHTWPQEKDGPRVGRILEAAGADGPDSDPGDSAVGTLDPGTRPLIPPVRKVAAGQLLDQVADSTGGQLVEQRTGLLDWHSSEHRRGVPYTVTLAAGEILNDLTFEQHVGDILNRLEISYGREDRTVTVRDPGSIDERDVYDGTLSTALATAIDAHDLGLEIVGRRSEPVWQLPALVVDLTATYRDPVTGERVPLFSPAKRAQLLALEHGDRIRVTGMPAAPTGAVSELYVEGITETATPRSWRLAIAVSDPLLSGVGVRWVDVDAALTWAGVDPALTWLDLARIENPADLA